MQHTIIIPHRDRADHLRACLWSIARSADVTGRTDYEVLVMDSAPGPFNKAEAINGGIIAASGEFITFLDADAIVGPRWLECVPFGEHITRVCYRVKYIGPSGWINSPSLSGWIFNEYDSCPLAFEAYGSPDSSPTGGAAHQGMSSKAFEPNGTWTPDLPDDTLTFGNSQFTIRREALGDLRFDENYAGRGFEDLDMIWRIWLNHGRRYKAVIWTDADHAMFHLTHDYAATWSTPEILSRHCHYYRSKRDATGGYRDEINRIRAGRATP